MMDLLFLVRGRKGLPDVATSALKNAHYLKRIPPITHGVVGWVAGRCVAVVTFGTPASRHLQISACKERPDAVLELNRLWVCDSMPRNSESWFISRALALLPPYVIVSYADTAAGHSGYVYRAANFNYAGLTDMDRKTPRFDYVCAGKHSRDAFRTGFTEKVRRKPKHRYWTVTGNRKDVRTLSKLCTWPRLTWKAPNELSRMTTNRSLFE